MITKALAIAHKDLLAEFRSKQIITSTLIFSLVVVVTFSIALGEISPVDETTTKDWLIPAVLWISFMFGGMMAISRSFTLEKDKNSLEGLLLAPMDRTAIYLGKVFSNLILMFIMEIGIILMVVVFFNYDVPLLPFIPILILGTVGFVVIASLLSALAINVKSSEHFLSVILFPILWGLIITVITATRRIFMGGELSEITRELTFLLMFDISFFAVSFVVFDLLVED